MEIAQVRVLTLDNVQRSGVMVMNRCYHCWVEVENYNNLLLQCGTSRLVWNLHISLFGEELIFFVVCFVCCGIHTAFDTCCMLPVYLGLFFVSTLSVNILAFT